MIEEQYASNHNLLNCRQEILPARKYHVKRVILIRQRLCYWARKRNGFLWDQFPKRMAYYPTAFDFVVKNQYRYVLRSLYDGRRRKVLISGERMRALLG